MQFPSLHFRKGGHFAKVPTTAAICSAGRFPVLNCFRAGKTRQFSVGVGVVRVLFVRAVRIGVRYFFNFEIIVIRVWRVLQWCRIFRFAVSNVIN